MAEPVTSDQVDQFVTRGFVRLRAAFRRSVADACVRLMWGQIRARAVSRETWTEPVIRHPA
jgi:hypothetical protein